MTGIIGGGLHPFEVGARRETFPITTQDDHPDGRLFLQCFERIGQFLDHLRVERIVLVRAVQGEDGNATGRRVELDCFVSHKGLLLPPSLRL